MWCFLVDAETNLQKNWIQWKRSEAEKEQQWWQAARTYSGQMCCRTYNCGRSLSLIQSSLHVGFQLGWKNHLNSFHFSLRGVLWWKNLISLFNIKVWGKKLRLVVWHVWFQNAFILRKWYELTNFNTQKGCPGTDWEPRSWNRVQNLFGGIDKEIEEAAPNIITEHLRMSNNNEQTVSTYKTG